MPFVIDDIAAAAATEAATAEVGSTVGVEATTSTELAAVPESTAVADDVLAENTSSLDMSDNVFVDEYPSQETSEVGVEPDKNVFYDEYPADVNTEADWQKMFQPKRLQKLRLLSLIMSSAKQGIVAVAIKNYGMKVGDGMTIRLMKYIICQRTQLLILKEKMAQQLPWTILTTKKLQVMEVHVMQKSIAQLKKN